MQFLTPLFWIAALSIGVPIFLHLTRRETRNTTRFASLMFLRKIPVQEVRRRKVRHPLLLALRCLGILLLVAAFAQPVLKGIWSKLMGGRVSVVILLDHSLSMSREGVWSRAVDAAQERIRSLRPGDEASLVVFGSRGEPVGGWEADSGRLLGLLQSQSEPSFTVTSYSEALRAAAERLEDASNRVKEVYLISDLQAAGLDMDQLTQLRLPPETSVETKDVGEDTANRFFDQVRLDGEVFGERYPHAIPVRVSAVPAEKAGGEVQLFLRDELIDRKTFELDAEGIATVNFPPFEIPEGVSRGKLILDVDDDFPIDNVRYFVIRRREPVEVALLASGEGALYLEDALSSGSNLAFRVRKLAGLANLDQKKTAVVVAEHGIQGGDLLAVTRFVASGGGLVVCLGSGTELNAFRGRWKEILPAVPSERRFARSLNVPFVSITEVDPDHPVFAPFGESRANPMTGVQFFGYWKLEPKSDASVLARFSTGEPALVESRYGEGRVLLFASSLGRVWSDFPLRSAYVPFWQDLVEYASDLKRRPAALDVDQVLSVSDWLADASGEERWDILSPQGRRLSALGLEAPERVLLTRPGFYEIRRDRETDWAAVNPVSRESNLTRLTAEEFQAAFQTVRPEGPVSDEVSLKPQQERGFWWLLIVMAVAVLFVESMLASYLSRRKIGFA